MVAALDDEVTAAHGWTDQTRSQWLRLIKSDAVRRRARSIIVLVICDRGSGQPLGSVSVDLRRPLPALGVILGPTARGRGIAAEAIQAFLPLLVPRGLRTIAIETAENNAAMRAVAERLGFEVDERYVHELPDGTQVNALRLVRDL
jgi:RimJ/RimL family protein N-acetyltransferase